MLAQLFRFEMRYHVNQLSFRVAAVLFLVLGVLMTFGSFGGGDVHANAPYVTHVIIGLLSLFMLFVSTLTCASVVLRDPQYGVESLVFASRVGRSTYFLARFGGLLGAGAIVIVLAAIGTLFATWLPHSGREGRFQWVNYLFPLLVFGLPATLFSSSMVFATALLTRNVRYVYAAGVALFILYFTASIFGNSPMMASSAHNGGGTGDWAVLLDPFGLTAFFGETRQWSAAQRNTMLFPITPTFLANRVLWAAISIGLLALTYARFQFRIFDSRQAGIKAGTTGPAKAVFVYRPTTRLSRGSLYQLKSFLKILRLETRLLLGNYPALALMALWVFFTAVELSENLTTTLYSVPLYASTGVIAGQLVAMRPALLLVIFLASEMIHRERATGMQALIFSSPLSKTTFSIAKSSALLCWILCLLTAHLLTGICFQLARSQMNVEWGTYLSLYYYAGIPLLLYAVLIIFVQTILIDKYLGMLLSGLVTGIFLFGKKFGLDSYLVRFASTPALQHSDMQSFGHNGLAFHGYIFYWASIAIVLAVLATRLWADGTYRNCRSRLRGSPGQWSRPALVAMAAGILCALASGCYIYSKAGRAAILRGGAAHADWQAAYERQYRWLENIPQPVPTAVTIETDLYPADHYYLVKGSLTLQNKTSRPIAELHFGLNPDATLSVLRSGNTKPVAQDHHFGRYRFRPQHPLVPGGELVVQFAIRIERSPFSDFNSENSLSENGSYIELEKYLPHLGYNPAYEITDTDERRRYKLPRRASRPAVDDAYHYVDFQNNISTEISQQVVSTGTLAKTWVRDRRRYFHYRSEGPVPYMFALSSAKYAVKTAQHQGITFRIYYHPGHEANVAAMMLAMKDAAAYGHAHFGRYPYRELVLAEIPHYPGSATAYPGVVFSNEQTNFITDFRDSTRFHFTYATTAHEMAHQWWAGRVAAPYGPGYALFTESLAKYTEAMVTEKRFGKGYLRPYHLADNRLYFVLRNISREPEAPLWKTEEQPFVHYQKGGLVFYRLKETLGEAHISNALRTLVDRHGYPLRKPRPADLIQALKQHASPGQKQLIDMLFKQVITHQHKVKILSINNIGNNRHLLTLQVSITKTDRISGKPVTLTPNDDIEIAVFDREFDPNKQLPLPIYQRKHHFANRQSIVTIVTDKLPVAVVLDPMACLLSE